MDILVALLVFAPIGLAAIFATTLDKDASTRNFLRKTMLIAFLVRVLVAVVFAVIPQTRVFHEDAGGYEWLGGKVALDWLGQGPHIAIFDGRPNSGYLYFVSALYYVIGPYPIIASLANCVFGTLTVNVVYRLSTDLFHPLVARRAARLVAFFPSMILWSAIAIKDPLMSLLIALSLWGCGRLKRRLSVTSVLLTALPVLAIQPVRYYVVYFVLFAIVISLVLERGARSFSGIFKQLGIVALVVALVAMAGLSAGVQRGLEDANFERLSTFRKGMASTADSGFSHDVDISKPTSAALFLPIGAATLLFAPFPWQLTSFRALLTAPEMLLWWSMIPALWAGLRFAIRERWREASPLLLFTASLTAAYSLMEGNVGAAFRQRSQIFIFLFVFAALGTYLKRCKRLGQSPRLLLVDAPGVRKLERAPAAAA